MRINLLSYSLFAASLIALLAPISCGGGGGGDSSGTTAAFGSNPGQYTGEQVVSRLEQDFGENGAIDAVLYALDKGYSIGQIVDAAMAGALSATGDIIDAPDSILAPANAPTNNINGNARVLARIQITVQTLRDAARRHGGTVGQRALNLILLLATRGFPPYAVIDGLITGEIYLDDGTITMNLSNGSVWTERWDDSEAGYITVYQPAPTPTATATPDSGSGCAAGTFTCGNGSSICADLVCNSTNDCSDGSDEDPATCDNDDSCCVATQGCPAETGSSCGEGCCCCGYGEACDQGNWSNGCVAAAGRTLFDWENLGKYLRSVGM